jgi:ABC-type Fe3+-siderophore transport system permease subunit
MSQMKVALSLLAGSMFGFLTWLLHDALHNVLGSEAILEVSIGTGLVTGLVYLIYRMYMDDEVGRAMTVSLLFVALPMAVLHQATHGQIGGFELAGVSLSLFSAFGTVIDTMLKRGMDM